MDSGLNTPMDTGIIACPNSGTNTETNTSRTDSDLQNHLDIATNAAACTTQMLVPAPPASSFGEAGPGLPSPTSLPSPLPSQPVHTYSSMDVSANYNECSVSTPPSPPHSPPSNDFGGMLDSVSSHKTAAQSLIGLCQQPSSHIKEENSQEAFDRRVYDEPIHPQPVLNNDINVLSMFLQSVTSNTSRQNSQNRAESMSSVADSGALTPSPPSLPYGASQGTGPYVQQTIQHVPMPNTIQQFATHAIFSQLPVIPRPSIVQMAMNPFAAFGRVAGAPHHGLEGLTYTPQLLSSLDSASPGMSLVVQTQQQQRQGQQGQQEQRPPGTRTEPLWQLHTIVWTPQIVCTRPLSVEEYSSIYGIQPSPPGQSYYWWDNTQLQQPQFYSLQPSSTYQPQIYQPQHMHLQFPVHPDQVPLPQVFHSELQELQLQHSQDLPQFQNQTPVQLPPERTISTEPVANGQSPGDRSQSNEEQQNDESWVYPWNRGYRTCSYRPASSLSLTNNDKLLNHLFTNLWLRLIADDIFMRLCREWRACNKRTHTNGAHIFDFQIHDALPGVGSSVPGTREQQEQEDFDTQLVNQDEARLHEELFRSQTAYLNEQRETQYIRESSDSLLRLEDPEHDSEDPWLERDPETSDHESSEPELEHHDGSAHVSEQHIVMEVDSTKSTGSAESGLLESAVPSALVEPKGNQQSEEARMKRKQNKDEDTYGSFANKRIRLEHEDEQAQTQPLQAGSTPEQELEQSQQNPESWELSLQELSSRVVYRIGNQNMADPVAESTTSDELASRLEHARERITELEREEAEYDEDKRQPEEAIQREVLTETASSARERILEEVSRMREVQDINVYMIDPLTREARVVVNEEQLRAYISGDDSRVEEIAYYALEAERAAQREDEEYIRRLEEEDDYLERQVLLPEDDSETRIAPVIEQFDVDSPVIMDNRRRRIYRGGRRGAAFQSPYTYEQYPFESNGRVQLGFRRVLRPPERGCELELVDVLNPYDPYYNYRRI